MRAPTDVSTGFESKNPSAHRAHPIKSNHTKRRHMNKLKVKRNEQTTYEGTEKCSSIKEQKLRIMRIKLIRKGSKRNDKRNKMLRRWRRVRMKERGKKTENNE